MVSAVKRIIGMLAALAVAGNAQAQKSVVTLSEGNSVSGAVVFERPTSVYVDLGFTVLEIPRESIVGIEPVAAAAESVADAMSGHDLYRVSPNLPSLSVRDWVERYGEAVVLVRTPTGLGSGFIVHPDGYLVTNDHVIAGEHDLTVTRFEGEGNSLERVQYKTTCGSWRVTPGPTWPCSRSSPKTANAS